MNGAGGSRLRHLVVDHFHRSEPYKSPKPPGRSVVPPRSNPTAHGRALLGQVAKIQHDYAALATSWEGREEIQARGLIIELEMAPEVELPTDRFLKGGLELLNERETWDPLGKPISLQSWFVPDGKLTLIAEVLNDYLTKTSTRKGKVQPRYRSLVDSIERIAQAAAEQLWTETNEAFPVGQVLWFEVWLRAGTRDGERREILDQFRALATRVGLRVGSGRIDLPEHTIVAVQGNSSAFASDLVLLNCIAEIRMGREYADFFTDLPIPDQVRFADDLRQRTLPPPANAPYICVLDTGINRGHPLLEPLLPESDNLTIKAEWSAADDDDHGTGMAGLAAYGDLGLVLSGSGPVNVPARLEGVKIVPPPHLRGNDEKLAGFYTAQGVAVAEAKSPNRSRVWCLATTMKSVNDATPSSWSAELDALACGRDNDGALRRLFCLSAGNLPQEVWTKYPDSNLCHAVENPGQSWNALCVGALTNFNLIRPEHAEYTPIAPSGGLAPSSSTSHTWENSWPNKPDVVFEGGNAGLDAGRQSSLALDELLMLWPSADFRRGSLGTACGTSPATALAARMAAQILGEYPSLWPETVRALMVHSADWTQQMHRSCPASMTPKAKGRFLLRTVGYGVPNLQRAIECAKSRVSLLAQCELKPFRPDGDEIVYNEMHLHSMPWPQDSLAANPHEQVRLRVTLSYFVEPNPGNRGYRTVFRYPGCQVRFRVSSPGQADRDLQAQVSKLAAEELERDESRKPVRGTPDGWLLGRQIERGSLHSDIWEGSAADLLSMRHIAVYPLTGWWRTRPALRRADARIRYALAVTIEALNPALDVYTEVATQVSVPIAIANS